MKKAIGTMILLAASTAAVMTPAVAADRDQRGYDRNQGGNQRSEYVSHRRVDDGRGRTDFRRDDRENRPAMRVRNDRYRHERDRDGWRYRFDRDSR